jgi:hypothetical protein
MIKLNVTALSQRCPSPCDVPHSTANRHSVAPWLNWIEQPPPKGQVIGSNPIGVTKNTFKIWLIYRALCRSLQIIP